MRGDGRLSRAGAALVGGAVLLAAGCGPSLPDPTSPGARVLAERCGGCHRVYTPGLMTIESWRFQLDRMRVLFSQRGIPWLTPGEERALLEYLAAHAGTS